MLERSQQRVLLDTLWVRSEIVKSGYMGTTSVRGLLEYLNKQSMNMRSGPRHRPFGNGSKQSARAREDADGVADTVDERLLNPEFRITNSAQWRKYRCIRPNIVAILGLLYVFDDI